MPLNPCPSPLLQVLSRLEGSWIDGFAADGRVLWDHTVPPCHFSSPPPHLLLPSDCSLRPDIIVRRARAPNLPPFATFSPRVLAGSQGRRLR